MAIAMQGVPGPPSTSSVTGIQTIRLGAGGDQITSGLRGRYYEATRRGQVFSACTVAATTWTVGLATTYTGLLLYNPSSTVNLELLSMGIALSTVQGVSTVFGLALGTVTPALYAGWTITNLATNSCLVGSFLKSQGIALTAAATFSAASTPLYAETLGAFNYSSNAGAAVQIQNVDLAGRYVLPANSFAITTIGQNAEVGFASLIWAEVPV